MAEKDWAKSPKDVRVDDVTRLAGVLRPLVAKVPRATREKDDVVDVFTPIVHVYRVAIHGAEEELHGSPDWAVLLRRSGAARLLGTDDELAVEIWADPYPWRHSPKPDHWSKLVGGAILTPAAMEQMRALVRFDRAQGFQADTPPGQSRNRRKDPVSLLVDADRGDEFAKAELDRILKSEGVVDSVVADSVREPDPQAPENLHALPDAALLAVLTGKAKAKRLLADAGDLQNLAQWSLPELEKRGGLPTATARRLHAAFAVGLRGFGRPAGHRPTLTDPKLAADYIRAKIGHDKRREHFVVLLLDSQKRLVRFVDHSVGSLSMTLVHPREIIGLVLSERAHSFIVGHNHPSGEPAPSHEDDSITRRLKDAGDLVGIPLVDSLVVTSAGDYYSYATHGRL